jgi:hypothetical protein
MKYAYGKGGMTGLHLECIRRSNDHTAFAVRTACNAL